MKYWRRLIVLVILLFAVSSWGSAELINGYQYSFAISAKWDLRDSQHLSLANSLAPIDQEFVESNFSSHGGFFDVFEYEHNSGSALVTYNGQSSGNSLPATSMQASAMVFRECSQTSPIYWRVFEFKPPDLPCLYPTDKLFSQIHSAWYMRSCYRFSHRLSGWKDTNSLYSACVTYQ